MQASHVEGQEFGYRTSQTSKLKNWYFSFPNQAFGIIIDFSMGQHYNVVMSVHCHNLVLILI